MAVESISENKEVAVPFLRWTGSKKWFVKKELGRFLPNEYNHYHEPFLGSGSVYFSLNQRAKSFLYDTNKELIITYTAIRDELETVIYKLKQFENTKENYYKIRAKNCRVDTSIAARMIFLNRCCFNGIYRVNSRNKFNVPYGHRKNVDIVTEENLRKVSTKLQGTNLLSQDFRSSLDRIQRDDFVFLDPPYTVAHEHNGFIAYNQKLFSWEDQQDLKTYCEEIEARGAKYILTNAYHKSLIDLYQNVGDKYKITRRSIVGGRTKTRAFYNELIVTNIR